MNNRRIPLWFPKWLFYLSKAYLAPSNLQVTKKLKYKNDYLINQVIHVAIS